MTVDEKQPDRRSYFQWLRFGFALHFGILFLLVASAVGFFVFQSFLRQLRYEPVQATIIKSQLKPCEDGMFSVDVAFAYTVNRRQYTTGKYRDDFGVICLKQADAEAIRGRYPRGKKFDAWYDPKRPDLAVLDRSLGIVHKVFLGVVAAFGVIFMAAALFHRQQKTADIPPAPAKSKSEGTYS